MLGAVAPMAAALAAPGPCVVVDLDPAGPDYPGDVSLADLVANGPTAAELRPPVPSGVALLRNGGVTATEGARVIAALVEGWPFVVLRAPVAGGGVPGPVVPVLALIPGTLATRPEQPAVYQRGGWAVPAPGPGVVVPRPTPRVLGALLGGRRPSPDRWLRSWAAVWRFPWQ